MKWTFQQIEGPKPDRKTLELDGWNAPFGRPRKEPVIKEVIASRIQTTRYPGSDKQTRHAFGTNWEETELKGRWMTKAQSDGREANDIADEWTQFVKDERTCRIAWGVIVSYTGYVKELTLSRESEDEIAWTMKLEIDSRDDITQRRLPPTYQQAVDNLTEINTFLTSSKLLQTPILPAISPDFLESLDNLAASLNAPAAEMNKLAGRFDDLEKASYSTLQHFRGAVQDMRQALISMKDTVMATQVDAVVLVRTAESDLAWTQYQLDLDNQSYVILDQLAQLDRKAELAQSNSATKFVTAIQGDSWEAIAIRGCGDVDRAAEIRSINGARYGERPQVGESYLVP